MIFVVAAVIALILNPVVAFVQRPRIPRGLAVLVVYLAFFLTLVGIGFLLANPISDQVRTFTDNLPHIVNEANKQIADVQRELNKHGIHVHLVNQGKTALQSIQDKVAKSASKLASFGGGLLTEAASAVFDLVLVFVLSVYMLIYGERIGALVRRAMPDGDGTPADDYPTLVQHAVSRYVGGQLLFSVLMGASAGVALYVFGLIGIFPDGRKYALAFGVFYGVMELVPYIGPILGALPAVLVALFTDPIVGAVGHAAVRRPAAAGGPHRRAADLRAHAAHQPAARDLRAAARAAVVRDRRRAGGAADPRDPARDGRLPQPPHRARVVGALPTRTCCEPRR